MLKPCIERLRAKRPSSCVTLSYTVLPIERSKRFITPRLKVRYDHQLH
jgi:hypothetical protein